MEPARAVCDRCREPALRADPAAQLRLLELQDVDLRLQRLAHRRSSLLEIAELDRLLAEHRSLRDAAVVTETEVADLRRLQAKADADVEQVRLRRDRDQQRLDSGQVGSPRELESLQHEIVSLQRRQGELEDVELDLMQRHEDAQRQLDRLRAELTDVEQRARETEKSRDAEWAGIDAEAVAAGAERASLAAGLPGDVLALYDKLRGSQGGVGAAALRGGRCEGCRLELTATERARLRAAAPDEVLRCEECRRILVRTPESGR